LGRPDECAELCAEGLSPDAIALRLGITTASVSQYLFVAVGRGLIRRSDILFSIDPDVRQEIDEERAGLGTVSTGWTPSTDGGVYLCLERDCAFMGDLYVLVLELEKTLHELIEAILKQEFGEDENGWWRRGVPEAVRMDCVTAREKDRVSPPEPYSYTTFIHLKQIIEQNWSLFAPRLPRSVAGDRRELMKSLSTANAIRNKVMHPVRTERPAQEEFDFVRELRRVLDRAEWRGLPG